MLTLGTDGAGKTADPRSLRSIRMFSSPPGAPRSRRPTDVLLFVIAGLLLLFTGLAVDPPGSLSNDLSTLVEDIPAWVRSMAEVAQDLMVAWAAFLVIAAIVRRHVASAFAAVLSTVVSLAVAFAAHRAASPDPTAFDQFIERFTDSGGPETFPATRLVLASSVVIAMSPAVTRPFRFTGRLVVIIGFFATIVLSLSTLVGAIGALAVGAAAAALVHLVIGSPGGRPRRAEIRRVLAELGVQVDDLEPASLEPAGVVLMDATAADGSLLSVKVYGRDAWDGQFINVLWRSVWYRDGRSKLLLTRLHQVEHEALMTLLAQRAGAPVPDIVVAGRTVGGDAAVVTGAPTERLIDHDGRIDTARANAVPSNLWSALDGVHRAGIVHGSLSLETVGTVGDGVLQIDDWSAAMSAAPVESVAAERAEILILSSMLVGSDEAIVAARTAIGDDALRNAIPYIQKAALHNQLRSDVDRHDLDLDLLRDAVADLLEADQVELVELRRVTLKSIATIVIVALAAMLLISSLSEIGIDTIVDELSTASWGWVLIALLVAQFARVWNGVGTTGATDHPLRLGPTVVLEFAITFVNLVIPSTAARFATKMRYFQRAGMTLTSATAMGAIDSIAGFVVQVTVLVSALLFGLGGIEFDIDIDTDSVQRLAAIVGVVIVVAIVVTAIVVAAVPSVRERLASMYRQIREALGVVRSPTRLLRLFGGNAMAELTFASVLGLSLLAYGESASIMSLLVINVGVALLAGLMPVPGGVGVSEAALTAGLVAIGVPEATAFATAITTRLCTFYLPPIWGYFAMRWLRDHEYL